jgi:Domain of unknown function (DUF4397)
MQVTHPNLAKRALRLGAVALLAGGLAGCQGIAGTQPLTQVRFIDASPDAPALDLYQNSTIGLYNIGFGTVSSYIPVASGGWTHAAYIAGTAQQLAAVHGIFAPGAQYTVLAGNVAAALQMTVLRDQGTPAPAGKVALRFVNQATRAGSVDLYLLPPGAGIAGEVPIATGLAFGSNTPYIDVPSSTYSIVAVAAGSLLMNSSAPIFTGSQTAYPVGSARTILLIDQQAPASQGLQIITADDFDPAN